MKIGGRDLADTFYDRMRRICRENVGCTHDIHFVTMLMVMKSSFILHIQVNLSKRVA